MKAQDLHLKCCWNWSQYAVTAPVWIAASKIAADLIAVIVFAASCRLSPPLRRLVLPWGYTKKIGKKRCLLDMQRQFQAAYNGLVRIKVSQQDIRDEDYHTSHSGWQISPVHNRHGSGQQNQANHRFDVSYSPPKSCR